MRASFILPSAARAGDANTMPTDGNTADTANTTGGGQANNTQAGHAGGATDAPNQSQATTQAQSQSQPAQQPAAPDPRVEAALKALHDAGVEIFTKKQFDGHMAQARRQWQTEAEQKAEAARKDAEQKALVEQQQYKPLYEQMQAEVKKRDDALQRIEPVLNEYLDTMTKGWPKAILDKKPEQGGYEARLAWYETYKDVAAEFLKTQAHQQQKMTFGNGLTPVATGVSGPTDQDARQSQAGLYNNW